MMTPETRRRKAAEASDRYRRRKRGEDIPKLKPGRKDTPMIEQLVKELFEALDAEKARDDTEERRAVLHTLAARLMYRVQMGGNRPDEVEQGPVFRSE